MDAMVEKMDATDMTETADTRPSRSEAIAGLPQMRSGDRTTR